MIQTLRLQNFRGYQDTQLEFEPGVNIIVGPNASGKTSVLEALFMLAQGTTFKGDDGDVVRFGEDWARVDALLDGGAARSVKLERVLPERVKKTYVLDGVEKLRLMQPHVIPVVLFEPQHMALLSGEPSLRRAFLDTILAATQPGYAAHLKNYRRILAQRNALLKRLHTKSDELFVWDLRLSELGGVVFSARKDLVVRMNQRIGDEYRRISARDETITLDYISTLNATDYANNLFKKVSADHEKDILRGFTGSGPHRDDLIITMNGHNAQVAASRGETRSLLLALKVLELYELQAALGKKPLLLLDDVFSELDGRRRRALADTLKNYQTFITTTDADIVAKEFIQATNVITTTPASKDS